MEVCYQLPQIKILDSTLILLDFQGTFDSLPFEETLDSLKSMGVPIQYIHSNRSFFNAEGRFIISFILICYIGPGEAALEDHIGPGEAAFEAHIGPWEAALKALACDLWKTFLSDLFAFCVWNHCKLLEYVDDLVILVCGDFRRKIKHAGNCALHKTEDRINFHNLKVYVSKYEVLALGKPYHLLRPTIFKYKEKNLKQVQRLKSIRVFKL